jgi:cephalosporin hydroxylase
MEIREDINQLLPILEEKAKKADFILEIGCASGNGSTSAFKKVMKQNRRKFKLYISVDIEDNILPEYRPQGYWWHLVLGDSRSLETLEKVKEISKGKLADIIFIDTEHNYDVMQKELEVWKNIAHSKTVWMFHDTWMSGNYNHMTDAIKEFVQNNPMWKYEDLSKENNGLGALVPTE